MDEHQAHRIAAEAIHIAEEWQTSSTSLSPVPSKDLDGHPVIGWGRRMESFPLIPAEAKYLRDSQAVQVRQGLTVQVNELLFANPEVGAARIAVCYSLALTFNVPFVKAWAPLWQALKLGRYRLAAHEIARCTITQLRGASDQVLNHQSEMYEVMLHGHAPELLN